MANSALTNPYKSDMDEVLAIVEKYTECDVLAGAVGVTQTDSCKPLFDAGFCFGAEAVDVNCYYLPHLPQLATISLYHYSLRVPLYFQFHFSSESEFLRY